MEHKHECKSQVELKLEVTNLGNDMGWCVSPSGTMGRGTYPILYCPACGERLVTTVPNNRSV